MRRRRIPGAAGGGPNGPAFRRVPPLCVMKILAKQPKFPELIGNVLADIGDRAIGTHDDLVLRICVFLRAVFRCFFQFLSFFGLLFPRHDPAARHFPGGRELNGT